MKIMIEHEGEQLILNTPEVECTQILQRITDMLVGIGYAQESVNEAILELAEELENESK